MIASNAFQSLVATPTVRSGRNHRRTAEVTTPIWNRRKLESRATWQFEIPDHVVDEFLQTCPKAGTSVGRREKSACPPRRRAELRRLAMSLCRQLLFGDGVVWLRGLGETRYADGSRLSEADLRRFHVELGRSLGQPIAQCGRLHPVRNSGGDFQQSALPPSTTAARTSFHTDSSHIDIVPDFVGLLCESHSPVGGTFMISNALQVHRDLKRNAPDLLALLERPYLHDVVTPGQIRTRARGVRNRFPIYAKRSPRGDQTFRYLRHQIERGHAFVGQPLDETTLSAFDALDARLNAPENVVTFRLGRGDLLWLNNRTIAHNRTADRCSTDQDRQLQRLWIASPYLR